MDKYRLTQKQFKVISELKEKFGDVSLMNLYTNSTLFDANGNTISKVKLPTIHQACRNLTDKQIEKLLGNKIDNMCIYTYYKLANHGVGLLSKRYRGFTVEIRRDILNNNQLLFKTCVESLNEHINLVAFALKTFYAKKEPDHCNGGYRYTLIDDSEYHQLDLISCLKIVFRSKLNGQFYASDPWTRGLTYWNYLDEDNEFEHPWRLDNFIADILINRSVRASLWRRMYDTLYLNGDLSKTRD